MHLRTLGEFVNFYSGGGEHIRVERVTPIVVLTTRLFSKKYKQ